MTKRNAKLNLTSKVARATVFALLFVLVLGVMLSAILYTDVTDISGVKTADATAGKYYSIVDNKFVVSAAALDGTTFSLDEAWDTSSSNTVNYWTQVNCSKQDILNYDSTPLDSDGYGMKTKSDNVKNGYNTLSTYAYLSIVPEDELTITKITVTTTYLYAKTSGSNGWSSADHSTKTSLSIVANGSSVEVGSVTASEYGNRSTTEKNENTNTNSLSTSVNNSGVIQIRLRVLTTKRQAQAKATKSPTLHKAKTFRFLSKALTLCRAQAPRQILTNSAIVQTSIFFQTQSKAEIPILFPQYIP